MKQNRYTAYEAEINKLPHLRPESGTDYEPAMEQHAPFVVTRPIARTDLGECIIQTCAPHYVCKIRAFPTNTGENPSPMKEKTAKRAEEERIASLERRLQLIAGDAEHFPTYDRELDEPRIVAKVPGLNVYLELFGCLDDNENIDWADAMRTMTEMALWAQNNWPLRERRRYASRRADWQPLEEWEEDYDPTLRPTLLRKCGIGIWPEIDASRRPELLYCHTSLSLNPNADIEGIKLLKLENSRLASEGNRNESLK